MAGTEVPQNDRFPPGRAAGRPAGTALRVRAFINPSAGAAATTGEGVLDLVRAAFQQAGIDAAVEPLPREASPAIERAVADAQGGDIHAVVVGGGDGTVNGAVAALAGTGVPLGVLPLGTLNHFAKDLGIPLELEKAVAVIAAGHLRQVDLGEMNGRPFINNSSIGIYPRLVLNRDRVRKQWRLSKWPAMAVALWRTTRALSHRRMRVRVEGTTTVVKTPCVFIGNNEYGTNVFRLGRRDRLDGGELWVYVVRPVGMWGFARLAARIALGLLDTERDLIVLKGKSAEIMTRRGQTLVALDGEVTASDSPLRYAARPKAVTVFAPAPNGDGQA